MSHLRLKSIVAPSAVPPTPSCRVRTVHYGHRMALRRPPRLGSDGTNVASACTRHANMMHEPILASAFVSRQPLVAMHEHYLHAHLVTFRAIRERDGNSMRA